MNATSRTADVTFPNDGSEPVFAEPWQAQAFALTVELNRLGRFTWSEWVAAFSAEIAQHPAAPGEDALHAYYRQWLAALESLVAAKGLSSGDEMARRKEEWRRAYLHTPHGSPVELARASAVEVDEPDDDHEHEHHHAAPACKAPIAASPARGRAEGGPP
jgi:nitrile hydratase accessory protein